MLCNRDARGSNRDWLRAQEYDELKEFTRWTHLWCSYSLVCVRGRAQLSSRMNAVSDAQQGTVLYGETHRHVSLFVPSRKTDMKKNNRAGPLQVQTHRDAYLSQTKPARAEAARTARPARYGRTGIFGTAARRAALLREAAPGARPAPGHSTRRSRRRPSCPLGDRS